MKTKTLLVLIIFLPVVLCADLKGKIAERLEGYKEKHHVTGLAAAVIGRENHEKFQSIFFLGKLAKTSMIPVNQFSEFRIGPVTQLFTASLLAYFVKEGQVSLSDPASKFLPKSMVLPTFNGKEMTLGDLATHTSGLPDFPHNLSRRSSFSVNEMFLFLKNYTLKNEPGTHYEYSNFGYAFLAHLLSRISKRSLPDILEQIVLESLSLKDTRFSLSPEQKKRCVAGYEKGRENSALDCEKIYSVFIGSGGLYSTAQNMLTFLSFNMGKEETSLNSILPAMQKIYHTFEDFSVGLGWMIKPKGLYLIQGSLFGFSSYMAMIPEKNIGIVLLSNQGDDSLEPLGEELLKILSENRK